MSLDVYLKQPGVSILKGEGSGIFIRENGAIREISRSEWDEKFPGREPILARRMEDDEYVYERNITHNLNQMADAAGIYAAMWRPDEFGLSKARQLIEPLREGLAKLKADPDHFKQFNPPNGWGDYAGLVDFVEDYLRACEQYPDADVSVSR